MPHIHEKIDFTAEVFVVHGNRVLLRKHDKYKIWMSVGGHIELDEDPNETALREVKEEVGLEIKLADGLLIVAQNTSEFKDLIPPKFLNRHKISDTHEHITMVYFATTDSDNVIPGGEDLSTEWKWFTKEELSAAQYDLTGKVKLYAERALDELGK